MTDVESYHRFTPMKTNKFTGKYSCGAMYATILNNPTEKRFLREETILVCVIPGPTEPSLEQLNSIIEPFVEEMMLLKNGMSYHIHAWPLAYKLRQGSNSECMGREPSS